METRLDTDWNNFNNKNCKLMINSLSSVLETKYFESKKFKGLKYLKTSSS